MRTSTRKLLRMAIVWTVIPTMFLNQSLAARFAGRRHTRHECACGDSKGSKGKAGSTASSGDGSVLPMTPPPVGNSPSDLFVPTPPEPETASPPVVRERIEDPAPPMEVSPEPNTRPLQAATPETGSRDPTPPPPVENTPPPTNPLENLFGDPDPLPVAPPLEHPAANDGNAPLNPPVEAEPVPEAPADDPLEDLFGDPGEAAPPRRAPNPGLPWAPTIPADLREVFAATITAPLESTQITPAVVPLQVRNWIDDTGAFGVKGRLLGVTAGRVRILKTNDRTCTIEISRLSIGDQNYVRRITSRNAEGQRLQSATE